MNANINNHLKREKGRPVFLRVFVFYPDKEFFLIRRYIQRLLYVRAGVMQRMANAAPDEREKILIETYRPLQTYIRQIAGNLRVSERQQKIDYSQTK